MGTLLEWFRTRREGKIIRRIKEDGKKVYNCVAEFKDALDLFFQGDLKAAKNSIQKVSKIENECDNIRREVLSELARGELSPKVRNDLAHLVNRLDRVANSANAAARHLAILDPAPLKPIADALLEMIDRTLVGAEILRDTIEIEIEGSTEEVDASIQKINRIEHEVDQIHYQILEKLNGLDYKALSPFVALNMYELIENIESISDACEETADFVKIINLVSSKAV
jgi:predicted phosphate transport protein (TIGR00153 family)